MDFTLSKEQRDIQKAAREFAVGEFLPEKAQEFDRNETFDLSIWRKACELGFVGVFIDEKYEGAGLGFFEHCLITEEFWAVDAGMGNAVITATFGSELLNLFGTEEQKQKYLPPLVRGEAIMGCAITEPDAGSDVTGAITSAVKDKDEWVINGSKMFITNGTIAKYMNVFCLTDPDNPDRHQRHSFFIVETDRKGFQANKLHGKLGIRANDTAEVSFSNVRIPASNLVGQLGYGFRHLMAFFNLTRLHICAMAVGIARAALEEASQPHQEEEAVRCASCFVPGSSVQDRRDGHHDPRSQEPLLRSGVAHRPGQDGSCGHGHGQMVFRADRCEVCGRGAADARRLRLH